MSAALGSSEISISPALFPQGGLGRVDAPTTPRPEIRCHRAASWIKRSQPSPTTDLDGRFIFLWMALNALYGRAPYSPRGARCRR